MHLIRLSTYGRHSDAIQIRLAVEERTKDEDGNGLVASAKSGPLASEDQEICQARPVNLAVPHSPRQRRKSPVTVQEWVASLPPPHLLQRKEFEPQLLAQEAQQVCVDDGHELA